MGDFGPGVGESDSSEISVVRILPSSNQLNENILPEQSFEEQPAVTTTTIAAEDKPIGAEEKPLGAEKVEGSGGVCRYAAGYWLSFELEAPLLNDITNYPAEIREDILASIVSTATGQDDEAAPLEESSKLCMTEALAQAFGFRDVISDSPKDSVQPWNLLPRFFWYKHELLQAHGPTAIVAEEKSALTDLLLDSDDDDSADEVEELPLLEEQAEGNNDQDPIPEPGVDITDDVVKGKKKRVTVIKQQTSSEQFSAADTLASTNALKNSHTDSFSAAIRDLQFRLNRHGFLADPKTYLGKGRGEEMYDKNDSLFDEDECVPVLESDDSDRDSADRSFDGLEDDMELLYQEGEHLFVMDDESESEEEQVVFASRQTDGGARTLVQCNFTRPTNIPCQYNPRGWRQPARKINEPGLPKVLRIFLQTLEYVISHKRTQILQRRIVDTYEFVDLDPSDPGSVRLSSFGLEQLTYVLNLIFETALLSFLLPHTPTIKKESKFLKYLTAKAPTGGAAKASDLPVIMESLTTSENQSAPDDTEKFLPVNRPITALLRELCSKFVSPLLPQSMDFYRNIWLPIGEYVATVMDHQAALWLQDMYSELCDLISDDDSGNQDNESVNRILSESLDLTSESSERWRRFVNTTTSIRFFTSIDQRFTALKMMVKEDCEPDMIKLFASDLMELRPTINTASSLDDPPAPPRDWSECTWIDIACGVFLEGSKFWLGQRQVIEQVTSPTTIPSGANQPSSNHISLHISSAVDQLIPEINSLLKTSLYRFPAELEINLPFQNSVLDYFSRTNQDEGTTRNLTGMSQSPTAFPGGQPPQKRRRESERAVSAPSVDELLMNRSDLNSEHQQQQQIEKKKRVRVLVTDILQTHFTRIIDLLQASPLLLPIPFGVALQCSNAKPSAISSHMMIVELHKFASVNEIELKLLHFDPPLPPDVEEDLLGVLAAAPSHTSPSEADGAPPTGRRICDIPYIRSFSDFLDQVHGVKRLSVEGRTRSLVFAGFDNRTKSFGLLCFPSQYPQVTCNSGPGGEVKYMSGSSERILASELKREDFISTAESSTVKGRLSLLDFLTLHLWLQIYAQITTQPSTLQLNLVFRNNKDITTSKVSQALWKALLAGGDLQKEWKTILDRYSFSQLAFLKKWIYHLNRIYHQKHQLKISWKTFDAPV